MVDEGLPYSKLEIRVVCVVFENGEDVSEIIINVMWGMSYLKPWNEKGLCNFKKGKECIRNRYKPL